MAVFTDSARTITRDFLEGDAYGKWTKATSKFRGFFKKKSAKLTALDAAVKQLDVVYGNRHSNPSYPMILKKFVTCFEDWYKEQGGIFTADVIAVYKQGDGLGGPTTKGDDLARKSMKYPESWAHTHLETACRAYCELKIALVLLEQTYGTSVGDCLYQKTADGVCLIRRAGSTRGDSLLILTNRFISTENRFTAPADIRITDVKGAMNASVTEYFAFAKERVAPLATSSKGAAQAVDKGSSIIDYKLGGPAKGFSPTDACHALTEAGMTLNAGKLNVQSELLNVCFVNSNVPVSLSSIISIASQGRDTRQPYKHIYIVSEMPKLQFAIGAHRA